MTTIEEQFTDYHEQLIEEIVLVAEATTYEAFTDLERLESAKRVIRVLLRTTPGKYWIPPLAPQDRHLGITKGYFRTVKLLIAIMEADSSSISDIIAAHSKWDS